MDQSLYLLYFIFFMPYKWVHVAKVFVLGLPFQPGRNKHSSLLVPFISYKENKVLLLQPVMNKTVNNATIAN
jgi:hypothetical protein